MPNMSKPIEEAVLLAISENINTVEKLSKYLNVHRHTIEKVLENLELKGLVVKEVRKFLFLKRVEYRLTEKGFDESVKLREKMMRIAKEMKHAYESNDRASFNKLYEDYRDFVPLMLALGLMDALWMSTILDFDYTECTDFVDDDFDVVDF